MEASNKKMCIAMVTDDYAPAKTGVGVHVQKIAGELIKRGTFAESKDSNVLQADARNLPDEFFRMWRCSSCFSLHSLVPIKKQDLDRPSPYNKRKINFFNRRMFEGFYSFLLKNGVTQDKRILFYGLSADLFKEVFESKGQSTVDIIANPLSAEELTGKDSNDYDVVIIMEHLECAEDPQFSYVS